MKRFSEVVPGVLRGGIPSDEEVFALKNVWGIRKIISLDLEAGETVDPICQKLGIEHLIIPIEHDEHGIGQHEMNDAIKFLSQNIVKLFTVGGPTYVHCIHGRDRTGFAVALFRVIGQGWTPEKALHEAVNMQFGQGISPKHVKQFEDCIFAAAKKDKNESSDVATQARESFDRGSINGPSDGSNLFSPITPVQDFVTSYPIEPTRDVAQVDDSRKRRRKIRKEYFQDVNDSMAYVGINDNINPMLRGLSPEGLSPMGIMPFGNYFL